MQDKSLMNDEAFISYTHGMAPWWLCYKPKGVCPKQEHDDGPKHPAVELEGVLHEERFERNPSKKFTVEHHSSMQEVQIRLSHVWHRLPLLKVRSSLGVQQHWVHDAGPTWTSQPLSVKKSQAYGAFCWA